MLLIGLLALLPPQKSTGFTPPDELKLFAFLKAYAPYIKRSFGQMNSYQVGRGWKICPDWQYDIRAQGHDVGHRLKQVLTKSLGWRETRRFLPGNER